ncbi:hypothetical protein EAO69_09925 [Streptomyces sp. me109]|nr:hypothetical protein EAO69_09925 [Streptomyces sp. me109]
MRDTVRRSPRGVEQAATGSRATWRTASITGSGAAAGATPGWLSLGTARIPHKVPEPGADSRT